MALTLFPTAYLFVAPMEKYLVANALAFYFFLQAAQNKTWHLELSCFF
jgi:hypothetical protein